jgi:hypothetical protein
LLISFDKLPASSRIWIYQAERELSASETDFIAKNLEAFVNQWSSHEAEVKGSFQILNDRFIVIASDESLAGVSGCSIDKSVNLVQALGTELKLNLIDRRVAYLKDNLVNVSDIKNLKEAVALGNINLDTIIFNNTVNSKAEFDHKWKIPAGTSWLSRYFAVLQ